MKLFGRFAFVAGVALAIALFAHEGFGTIVALLRVGGAGLLLVALFHVAPMLMNARAWQLLLPPASHFSFRSAAWSTWLRESINGLLPVARVGGEIAAYRIMVRDGIDRVPAAASMMVDLVLSMLSQSLFTLVGIAVMLATGIAGQFAWQMGFGFAVLCLFAAALIVLQRSRVLGVLGALSQRFVAGRWGAALGASAHVERTVHAIYARRRHIVSCVVWQLGGWILGAGEIWLALFFIGKPASLHAALVVEVVVQTVSSVAFLVPGAYGVQEGAFLLIGAALGFDGPTSLALAASRRARDLIVFVPGLCAWSWAELRERPGQIDPVDA